MYKFVNNLEKVLGYSSSQLHSMLGITTLEEHDRSLAEDNSKSPSTTQKRLTENSQDLPNIMTSQDTSNKTSAGKVASYYRSPNTGIMYSD